MLKAERIKRWLSGISVSADPIICEFGSTTGLVALVQALSIKLREAHVKQAILKGLVNFVSNNFIYSLVKLDRKIKPLVYTEKFPQTSSTYFACFYHATICLK
jgi:hypothetical protein